MFENFKIYGFVELPDYVEYFDEDNDGVLVSVLCDNLSSFFDWATINNIKVESI